jgi:hypothetical protein
MIAPPETSVSSAGEITRIAGMSVSSILRIVLSFLKEPLAEEAAARP